MSLKSVVKRLEQELKPRELELSYAILTPEERKQRINFLLDKARESHNPLSETALIPAQRIIDEYLVRSGKEPIYSK